METLSQIIDLKLEIHEFLQDFEKKLNNIISEICPKKKEVIPESFSITEQEAREEYFTPMDFEYEMNLFAHSFVRKVCEEAEQKGDLHLFGVRWGKTWRVKPLPFLEYLDKRGGRCAPKARRFLQSDNAFKAIQDIFDKKKS